MVMMKVKDLINQLNKLDPNLDVFCYTDDNCFATNERSSYMFSIEEANVANVEGERNEKNQPIFRFCEEGKKGSRKIAIINISTDF